MTASARSALLGLLAALVLLVGTTGCRLLGGAPTPPPPEPVTVLWAGAVTDTSARIHARVPTDSARVQVAVTTADDWADPTIYAGTRSARPHRSSRCPSAT